jgi:GT2 family glycosyltransferase
VVKTVVVLGMHRSGTSLIARCLDEAGISGGPSAAMLDSQLDNPLGFYERRDVVAANDSLLSRVGCSWFAPPNGPLSDTNTESQAEIREALTALYSDVCATAAQSNVDTADGLSGESSAFIKDPRLCLTWPLWRSQLETDSVVLYVYRDPVAVAQSLHTRNGFPHGFGLLLWEYYNRLAIEALTGQRSLCVSYDQIGTDPKVLPDLLKDLQALGVPCDPDGATLAFKADLRHFRSDDPAIAQLQSYEQTLLARHAEALCRGEKVGPLPPATPGLHARITDLAAALEPLSDARETRLRLSEARDLIAERTAERDRVLEEWETLDASHQSLAAAHEKEVAEHRETIQQRDEWHARSDALATERDGLQAEVADLTEKTNYLFHQLTNTYTRLLDYEQSTLARLNRGVTRLYKLLTNQRSESSRYEDVLATARAHLADYDIDVPERQPGKLAMLGNVLRYLVSNPIGSLRSLSWPRIRRAFGVFFGSSAADLQVWIDARFPEQARARMTLDPAALSPGLDRLTLEFPPAPAPKVSIVVPVYNDYRVTVHCLQSVLRHTPAGQYEVLVADDGSDDLTTTIEERLQGITVVRGGNLGFLRNCNRAAAQARGDFVLLLNNDTAVTEGWLEALLEMFDDPQVGAAGPKLLFANGALQEAGGIMWKDGSAWNFGRMDDAAKPAYSYVKEVDYISGACLMLRRKLWQQLGGFDERFVPAYYEDADIRFAVRDAGYKVIYQPASCVFHFEGVSNGTDLTAGVKQHQVTNQQIFADKWQPVLEREHFPNAEHVIWARDRSEKKPCVLFIDHYVPHYDKDAGSRSTFMYVKLMLAMGYRVQFMGANFFAHAPYTAELQQLGVEVLVGESIARGLDAWLAEHAPYINQIFLHRPHVAEQFLPHLKKLSACPPINFVGHDLHYLRIGREAQVLGDASLEKSAASWRQREYAVFDQVDRIYYFSHAEIEEIAHHRPDLALRSIPLYALDDRSLPDYAPTDPRHLLFVGGFNHPPNVDAASWFSESVLPRVLAAVPGCHLHLVGSNANSTVKALAGDAVTVHGYLEDDALEALYRRVGAAVVPLRYGAGVKGKVLEAVQHNVPLVTTTIGAEGIPDAGEVMWIADEAEAFADTVIALLDGSADPRDRLSRYAPWLDEHFSRARAEALLRADFEVSAS